MNAASRFRIACLIALPLDAGLIFGASQVVESIAHTHALDTIEVRRVVIDDQGHKEEKIVTKQEVQKRIQRAIEKPKRHDPAPKPKAVRPVTPTKPPEGAHNKVLTVAKTPTGPNPPDHTALAGGNADVGKPTTGQQTGTATTNPPTEPPKDPPKTDPLKTDPPKTDPPKDPPKTDPPKDPPKTDPPKVDPPKPKGPTREAEATSTAQPSIPDELKQQDFKAFVRVRVEIDADGSFTVTLRTSSGNGEVDRRVLEALKRWKWRPAMKDGEAVKSVQLFKFEFEVN